MTEKITSNQMVDQRFGPAFSDFEFTVPGDYDHNTQIDTFGKKTRKLKTTFYLNNELTSKNFAKATNKLEPGKTYKVKIFPILATVTGEDCMTFLAEQNAILVGGQGITLLQAEKVDKFPVDKWMVSFDEKDALLCTDSDRHWVPVMCHWVEDSDWSFDLCSFESGCKVGDYLLCVCNL